MLDSAADRNAAVGSLKAAKLARSLERENTHQNQINCMLLTDDDLQEYLVEGNDQSHVHLSQEVNEIGRAKCEAEIREIKWKMSVGDVAGAIQSFRNAVKAFRLCVYSKKENDVFI